MVFWNQILGFVNLFTLKIKGVNLSVNIPKSLSEELAWIAVFFWVILIVGGLTGFWREMLFVFLVYYLVRQLWNIRKFENWIQSKNQGPFPRATGFWHEISYLVAKKQKALEKRASLQSYRSELFRAASMALPISIISLNEHHHIEWFNLSAEKILSIRQEDIGRKIETLVRSPDFVQYLKGLDFSKPLILEKIMGENRAYRCQVIDYYEGHRLLLLEDIHELYHLAQIRKDFVANASHELRTPLTVLNGYLEMMIDMPESHQQQWLKPLEQMHQQSVRMHHIVEDLLTLSAIESDTLMKKVKTVLVDKVLKNTQTDIEHLYAKNYQIIFEITEGLSIKGVEEPLKSVFSNLISNAFRYTPEGGVIKVRWYLSDEGAHFEVEDSGIGISTEHLSRLTERFYRVDTARSRGTGGTGLGLAIVKHVLDKHDSVLKIDSQVGKGSLFGCDFPMDRVII